MSEWPYKKKGSTGRVGRFAPPSANTAKFPARVERRETGDDVGLDFNKDSKVVVCEILRNISKKEGVTKGRRLAYLNAFVKFLQKISASGAKHDLGFSTQDICFCLRVCLVQDATVVRAAAIRALRYLVTKEGDLAAVEAAGIPFLLVRSLDFVLNNSAERLQVARFCQKMMSIPNGANFFGPPLGRAVVAIGFDGVEEQDKLHRWSLSMLCQLALLNPHQLIECGGVRVILHNVLSCSSPMVLEALLGSVLHLLNVPLTRDASRVALGSLLAPLTDLHFKHSPVELPDKEIDEREVGYRASKTAIGTILRSWSGIAHFCQSDDCDLQSLVDALYIEQHEIRRTILELICEIVGLKFPTWTDEVSVALTAVDASAPKESWRLQEGFVVAEAEDIFPHLAHHTPNVTANHMALLVFCFARRGLLDALVEVIVSSDTFLSVRATVLLGELLSLVDQYLPIPCFDPSEATPSLFRHALATQTTPHTSANIQMKQHRALEAISVLSALQKIKARPPTPHSLFLTQQAQFAGATCGKNQEKFVDRLGQVQTSHILKKDMEGNPNKYLKESGVLYSKDPFTWAWETIYALLRWAPGPLKRVEDSAWRSFLRRLLDFFKPSNNVFGRIEAGKEAGKFWSRTGLVFVHFLAEECENFSGATLLEEFLADIGAQLDELIAHRDNPFLCTLSPGRVENTLSYAYFLFIGKLSEKEKGARVLDVGGLFERLLHLVVGVGNEIYSKLVISSLFYGNECCRRVLGAALESPFERTRLYATQFLRVLVRLKLPMPDFGKWVMELLVNQMRDKTRTVSLAALHIAEEAVHDKMLLESLISLRPTLSHLGDRGLLLLITFLSLPSGFKFLVEANFLKKEILKWTTVFNKRYVELVEVLVRDTVSTLRRGEDGRYPQRASRTTEQSKFINIFVPPHLYGQLCQHKPGMDILLDLGQLDFLMDTVRKERCESPEDTRELKAALWALSHMGTSTEGISILEEGDVIEAMVDLAATCPILSVRHTVFHCLCLLSTTHAGALRLERFGWHAMPRSHHEMFPLWPPQVVTPNMFSEADNESDTSRTDTCSNILEEEDGDNDSVRFFVMEDELVDHFDMSERRSSQPPESKTFLFHHQRSFSESQGLAESNNDDNFRDKKNDSFKSKTPFSTLSSSNGSKVERKGSWRSRRSDSVGESTTSGVSSSDSSFGKGDTLTVSHVQTLSPIPSSASIATTTVGSLISTHMSPSRTEQSSRAQTDPGRFGSPNNPTGAMAYRSMIRKPVIRMPNMSDSDIYPMGSRKDFPKTGSLDRNLTGIILNPKDLFNESKYLRRANSSLTSLSTPSFRLRPEAENKIPCFMGLCLPRDFSMIFAEAPIRPARKNLNSDEVDGEVAGGNTGGDVFEFHTIQNCLGCLKLKEPDPWQPNDEPVDPNLCSGGGSEGTNRSSMVSLGSVMSGSSFESGGGVERVKKKIAPDSQEGKNMLRKEILRLISAMVSCVGAKSNEQGLLRLKQRFPKAFQDICLYSELCVILSQYNVRLLIRRFLQELFFDLPFEEFYTAASNVVTDPEPSSLTSMSESEMTESEAGTVIEVHQGANTIDSLDVEDLEMDPPSRELGESSDDDDDNSDYVDLK